MPPSGGDAVALADAQDAGIDVGGAGLQRAKGVGDGAARVVVAVELDIAADALAHPAHQVVDLQRRGHAHGVGDAHPVDAQLRPPPHRCADDVVQVAAERVLGAESAPRGPAPEEA